MLDLNKDARPDERFHLQTPQPTCSGWGRDWFYRSVTWQDIYLPNGKPGRFTTHVLLWFIRWYAGTVKCDATRTYMYRSGQLGEPYDNQYVMTTTPKEMLSVRLRWRSPRYREWWDNMGGI